MSKIKMKERDEKFIRENFENAEELISSGDVETLLLAIYDLMDRKGFAPPDYYYYNDFGEEAQDVYSSIHALN